MKDELSIGGTTPGGEECAQVGTPGYYEKAQAEGKRFIAQIRKEFGPEPEGAKLKIKGNPHDFGTYYDVVVQFEVGNTEAEKYAYDVENNAPYEWEE